MSEDISEMEDFCDSKDYYIGEHPSEGFKTGIFWDAEACPFPEGIMDPDVIYQKIESALSERGSPAKMSIMAYVDDKKPFWDEFLRKKKTWKASICFQPLGLKPAMRMLNDILLWVRRSLPPANLIFVSDKVYPSDLLTGRLRSLVCWPYSVYVVEPTGYVESLEWPESLFDDHMTKLEREEEVNPAKRRAVEKGSED